MEPKKLLDADYLDILYDERNKRYGGYELRRHYDQRLRKAATFALAGVAVIFSFSFVTGTNGGSPVGRKIDSAITIADIRPRVQPPPPKPMKTTPPAPAQQIRTRVFVEPVIEPDKLVTPNKQLTQNKDVGNAQPGLAGNEGDSTGLAIGAPNGTGSGLIENKNGNAGEPVRFVEQMPVFAGDMADYLGRNLHYPENARAAGIEGRVLIEFVLNEDGSVSNAKIVRGIGGGCDEEALRIINKMPKWKPGKQNGLPVKVFFSLPIVFQLN